MRREEEAPLDDDQVEDATEPDEEEEDPLADLSDEDRERFQAIIAQQVEAQVATRRTELDNEFAEHRKQHTRRVTAARKNLQDRLGADFDDEGNVVLREPARLSRALLEITGQVQADKPAEREPEEFDWSGNVEQQIDQRIQRGIADGVAKIIDEKLGPLMQQFSQFSGMASQPVLSRIPDIARDALEETGVGHLADHQDFDAAIVQAVKDNASPDKWNDPDTVANIAGLVGMSLQRGAPDRKAKIERRRDETQADLHRSGLGAIGASRGGGREGNSEAQQRREYEEIKRAFPDLSGMTFKQYQASQSGDYGDYVAAGRRNGNGR